MKRIVVGIMVAAIACLLSLSHASAWDGERCDKAEKEKTEEWIWHDCDDDHLNEWFELDLRCLEEAFEGLEALEGLEELEGFHGLHGLEALEALEDLDVEIDVEGLMESLQDLEIVMGDVNIPPLPPIVIPLPPLAVPVPRIDAKHYSHFHRDREGWDVRIDTEDLAEAEELRLHALSALGRLDADEAIPVLEKTLREENHPAIRSKALSILRKIDDERVIPVLGEVARTDPDFRVRKKAIHYLGRSGDRRALEILEEILEE